MSCPQPGREDYAQRLAGLEADPLDTWVTFQSTQWFRLSRGPLLVAAMLWLLQCPWWYIYHFRPYWPNFPMSTLPLLIRYADYFPLLAPALATGLALHYGRSIRFPPELLSALPAARVWSVVRARVRFAAYVLLLATTLPQLVGPVVSIPNIAAPWIDWPPALHAVVALAAVAAVAELAAGLLLRRQRWPLWLCGLAVLLLYWLPQLLAGWYVGLIDHEDGRWAAVLLTLVYLAAAATIARETCRPGARDRLLPLAEQY